MMVVLKLILRMLFVSMNVIGEMMRMGVSYGMMYVDYESGFRSLWMFVVNIIVLRLIWVMVVGLGVWVVIEVV